MNWVLVFLSALLGFTLGYRDYSGYQVLRSLPLQKDSVFAISQLYNDPRFDFWSKPRIGRHVDIMTSSDHVNTLRETLESMDLSSVVYIENVGIEITKEREAIEKLKSFSDTREVTFDRYMENDEILAYIHEVADANPSIASILEVTTSSEGRPVHALKISSGPNKKVVWMDCGLHAREWASPPVCLKTIEKVMASPELQELVDWHILPVANPDGYVFSWSEDRLWKKNRRIHPGQDCVGTDLNRNFDWRWNGDNITDPCDDSYPGANVFSEVESKAIADIITPLVQAGELIAVLTIHSYGQVFYYPYSTQADPAPTASELQAAGDASAAAIATYRGTIYDVHSESNPPWFVYGVIDDYSYGVANIPYAYNIEMPSGGSNYDPPVGEINPITEEAWLGIEALVRHIHSLEA